MTSTTHLLPLSLLIIALGFVLAGLVLTRIIPVASNPIWQASVNGGQLAVACVLAGVVIGFLVGVIGQIVQLSRESSSRRS